jgi:DNA repair protein RadC
MKPYVIPKHHGTIVLDGVDLNDLDAKMKTLQKEFTVREIDITFKEEKIAFNQVRSSKDAYQFIKDVLFEGMEIQEHFVVLFLSQSNQIIGYYRHSKGTINSTQVDIELVMAVAIKSLSKAMIVSHNHPSGNKEPSEADRTVTKRLKQAAALFDISVLDHVIVTNEGYYSFADSGERSLSGLPGRTFNGLRGPAKPGDELEFDALNYAAL